MLTQFDVNRDKNLYKIWNRLCSGSYFPSPVREKSILKEEILGIPPVSDRIAQGAVKHFVEEAIDPLFHEDSYGYRPGRSTHQAPEKCALRCRTHNWALTIEISSFSTKTNIYSSVTTLSALSIKLSLWVITILVDFFKYFWIFS
jgi:RNA-directed DNA polymerase